MSTPKETPEPPLPPLLTPQQVARELAVSVTAVYELCSAGLLLHRRVGVREGRIRIARPDLNDYLGRAMVAAEIQSKPVVTVTSPGQLRRPTTIDCLPGASLLRAAGWNG